MKFLANTVGSNYKEFPYVIASCNVFVHNQQICAPAEIGITKFQFNTGVYDHYHSFVAPKDVPLSIDH